MKFTLKLMTILLTIFAILAMDFLLVLNSANAASITNVSEINLYSRGKCGQLLKYKGVIIKTYYVEYFYNGNTYPAYCLDKTLTGVSDDLSYSVFPEGVINDIGLWRRIINGYPYKSEQELGVANKEEAFTATKQAIYCYLNENRVEDYEAIGEAGERTLNALKQICTNAENSTETQLAATASINPLTDDWSQDEIKTEYLYKIYSLKSNASSLNYEVDLQGDYPEGTIITDMEGNEVKKFSNKEKFKVMIPKSSLKKDGTFTIDLKTEVKTKPVIFGASPGSAWQSYALTAYMYEDVSCNYEENYNKIEEPKNEEEIEKPVEEIKILPITGM